VLGALHPGELVGLLADLLPRLDPVDGRKHLLGFLRVTEPRGEDAEDGDRNDRDSLLEGHP
jgi:hypothetical protein